MGKINTSPIIVTGCPRSGASMVSEAIRLCGAFSGTVSNRQMFSNERIKTGLVMPYLRSQKVDEHGQFPLHAKGLEIPSNWKTHVEEIIEFEGYKKGPWLYKDSQATMMWPIWDYAYPDAKWVIVRRRTGDIIQSCLKTSYMKAFSLSSVGIKGQSGRPGIGAGHNWRVRMIDDRDLSKLKELLKEDYTYYDNRIDGNI